MFIYSQIYYFIYILVQLFVYVIFSSINDQSRNAPIQKIKQYIFHQWSIIIKRAKFQLPTRYAFLLLYVLWWSISWMLLLFESVGDVSWNLFFLMFFKFTVHWFYSQNERIILYHWILFRFSLMNANEILFKKNLTRKCRIFKGLN